ncbi:MAG: hypothetical protein ACK4M2_01500 [Brevundimonas sp.]
MISVEVHDEQDAVLAKLWMRFPPRKGELLWFAGEDTDRLRKAHGASAFRVTDVAHWISSAWSPNTHVGQPVHSVCVYVEPVEREDAA